MFPTCLGCVNPVEKVIELVHRNGGVVLVDAAQSAPHMKVDVQALVLILLHSPATS